MLRIGASLDALVLKTIAGMLPRPLDLDVFSWIKVFRVVEHLIGDTVKSEGVVLQFGPLLVQVIIEIKD